MNRSKSPHKGPLFLGTVLATAAALIFSPVTPAAHADQAGGRAFNNWDRIDINTGSYDDVLARDAAGDLWVYAGDGRGGWKKPRFKMGEGWNVMTAIIGAGKFQSEFSDDLLARDRNGDLWLYPGTGGGSLKPRTQVGTGWNAMTAIMGPGDFDGDYCADVIARDAQGLLWLYPGDHQGGWHPRVQIGEGWNVMTALIGRGDFNEDGKRDVMARDTAGRLWLYPGDGKGGWLPRMQVGEGWNTMTAIIATGRFDGNYPDIRRSSPVTPTETSGSTPALGAATLNHGRRLAKAGTS